MQICNAIVSIPLLYTYFPRLRNIIFPIKIGICHKAIITIAYEHAKSVVFLIFFVHLDQLCFVIVN